MSLLAVGGADLVLSDHISWLARRKCASRYLFVLTEANGPLSQHMFRKMGFQERHMVSCKDLRFDDHPVFAAIESTRGIMLMEADIRSQAGA